MTMRTSLKIIRGLGSAKDGTQHFWNQRITAIANVPLVFCFVVLVVILSNSSHSEFIKLVSSPVIALLLTATVISVTYHMHLGMQIIIEDYVHRESTKIILLICNTLFSCGVALTSLFAILKISFGG